MLEQGLAAHLAEAGHVVEQALDHRLGAPGPVVGDREPVGLVADPLQQVEALGACAARITGSSSSGTQTSSSRLARPQTGMSSNAELGHRLARGRDLRRAAVDDDQARGVGELARPPGLGVDQHRSGLGHDLGRSCPASSSSRRNRRVITSCIERDVVLAVDAPDHEPAVLALAGQAVLEDHHRGDHLGALEVGDVVALDPQRHLVGSPSACWISSSARLRVVRSLARLVLWSASDWAALRATVSWRVRLSPRCGTRIRTRLPRRSRQQLLEHVGVGRQRRDQHLARDRVAGSSSPAPP